jgi:transglutaminase-like putative cysteine protease
VYGQEGHVWAEVLTEGKGWQQVDPSGGPVGWHHVPWFVTEDGKMPIVYVRFPRLTLASSQ